MLYLLRQLIFCVLLILVLLFEGMSLAEPTGKEENAMPDPGNVAAIMKKAKEDAKKITLPVNHYEREGLQAAKQTSRIFHSSEFQERIQCEQERLEKEVFGQYITPWKKKKQKVVAEQTVQSGRLSATGKVFLFISSSVPDDTVHAYISVISRIPEPNVVLVMNGVVGGLESKEGIRYFSRIVKKDLTCRDRKNSGKQQRCPRYQVSIAIASNLFAEYGITRVPAVVYRNDTSSFLIQGDAALDHLLERINREAKSTTLDKLIKKIRRHG